MVFNVWEIAQVLIGNDPTVWEHNNEKKFALHLFRVDLHNANLLLMYLHDSVIKQRVVEAKIHSKVSGWSMH